MTVLGTAGHVDHGKTSLVRALTGIDTDRLPEEKARGITIELGFAPLSLSMSDGSERVVSIVDVPGHERFVGTMIAGAHGLDAAMLVVAADEGVMPQTREHLAVLDLLGVRGLLVALTRCDLVDAEMRALATTEVEELLAASRWPDARVVPVSAVTLEGIDALRSAIAALVVATDREQPKKRPARLSCDRVFSPRGIGVVVTGTLVAGELRVGDTLALSPHARVVRVRGLHVHGHAVAHVTAGTRVAIAVAGVTLAEIERGAQLSTPGSLLEVRAIDGLLRCTKQPKSWAPRARFRVHVGTDEVDARLVSLAPSVDAKASVRPVRAILARAVPIAPGDPLVVRASRSASTIGSTFGAIEVVRVAPPRLARAKVARANELISMSTGTTLARATIEIDAAGLRGMSASELAPRLVERAVDAALQRSLARFEVRAGSSDGARRFVGARARAIATAKIMAAIDAHHRAHPDDEAAPRTVATSALPSDCAAGLADLAIEDLALENKLIRVDTRLRSATFAPRIRVDDPIATRLAETLAAHRLTPPTLTELAALLGLTVARARSIAQALALAGRIVHVKEDLWIDRAASDDLIARVVVFLTERGAMTTGELKELIGASRKYVMPLAEWLDDRRVTMRVGDVRKLRAR